MYLLQYHCTRIVVRWMSLATQTKNKRGQRQKDECFHHLVDSSVTNISQLCTLQYLPHRTVPSFSLEKKVHDWPSSGKVTGSLKGVGTELELVRTWQLSCELVVGVRVEQFQKGRECGTDPQLALAVSLPWGLSLFSIRCPETSRSNWCPGPEAYKSGCLGLQKVVCCH